jgi:protein dithiol oxidoreductase (disulfide-forming)
MRRHLTALLSALLVVLVPTAHAAPTWVEGTHYERLPTPQRTTGDLGKVEVLEVFSYGCPACNRFQPEAERIRHDLPANAQWNMLPASWNKGEDWPMLQQAFFTARVLGVADKAHQAVFDAIWKTGELAIVDPRTNQLKNPLPSIQDAAQFYKRTTGVSPDKFLEVSKSFAVNMKMRAADAQITAMEVPSTPSIIVNGKYRVNLDALGGYDDIIGVIRYLVSLEAKGPKVAAALPAGVGK